MAENMDFSNAIEQLQQMLSNEDGQSQLQSIVNMFTGGNDGDDTEAAPPPSIDSDGLDMETVMKLSSIMQAMNNGKDNPQTAFFKALKPFLKESRQAGIDRATKLIKLATVLKAFQKNNRGDA